MLWIAVALFFAAYIAIVVMPMLRRRRAAESRVSPETRAMPLSPDELRERLKKLESAHPEIVVEFAGEMVRMCWNLAPEEAHAKPFQPSPQPTYMLELQIHDDHSVHVRYATGTIVWEPTPDSGIQLMPVIDWLWPLEPVAGGGTASPQNEVEGEEGPVRTLGHLVHLARTCVLDAGFAWQPAIDLRPGEGVPEHVGAAVGNEHDSHL